MKAKDEDLQALAKAVKEVFRDNRGKFSSADFIQVADLLGFQVFEKGGTGKTLKPVAENYLPEIISTNLQYAVEAYEWGTHIPMTEEGMIVSGFWDRSKDERVPEGYVMDDSESFLILASPRTGVL